MLRARSLYQQRYDLDAGIDFIVDQLQGSGKDHGYRWMYTKCKQHDISIKKECQDPYHLHQARRLRKRQYFAQALNFVWHILGCGGFPKLVRTDMGTKNVVIKDIQWYLERNNEDDKTAERSYITGARTVNQRIESW